ncbi:DUF2798 domain-containing protein [Dokdonia sinensis]|uniref:DUF2798 domain-containing protein n=1 Tax=Dokdonia sinensis TaxID=2479847 RepID=A0A3M0G4E2_9FLAO|nr:DUF2798 domain-containing protein [Dokdonia sinensis]RMB56039.1 DUF2798 domain-containing protein [Dokdonia sinensis]
MKKELKRKIAFALSMGIITTAIVSFTLIVINVGFNKEFVAIWLKSWFVAYIVVVPFILILGPRLQTFIDSKVD